MPQGPQPRVIAIAIIRRNAEILLMGVQDRLSGLAGFRPLGGAVEFGERAIDAVRREFLEEITQPIMPAHLICVLENHFVHEGHPGHEIVFVFEAEFEDPSAYDAERFDFVDADASLAARWVALNDLRQTPSLLYPKGLLERL